MKSKILTIIALCFAKILFAQDSIRVETVIDTAFKTPQYETEFEDVFLSHQEAKWLFKYDPLAWMVQNDGGVGEMRVEFERKLSQSFSLNTSWFFQLSTPASIYAQSRNIMQSYGFATNIESRWYYQMAKKIAANKSANNLSGNYWGLKLGAEIIPKGLGMVFLDYVKKDTFFIQNTTHNDTKSLVSYRLEANYGIQRRLYKQGYINFSFGIGLAKEQSTRIESVAQSLLSYRSFWRPYFNNRVSFGWAFGGDKRKPKPNIVSCDLFRCFEEENKLLKINLLGLFKSLDPRNIAARTAISYEFWLLNDKNVSFNSTLSANGKYYSSSRTELNAWAKNAIKDIEAKLTIEPRYYNRLKRNMARGKSAHNFSGGYFGLPISYAVQSSNLPQTSDEYFNNNIRPTRNSQFMTISAVFGIQKRIFKNGFWDFSAGPGYRKDGLKPANSDNSGLNFVFRSELGFAF
jgi:hypothetical protein